MLNAERRRYKYEAAAIVRSHVQIGVYVHDCACTLSQDELRCDRLLLDKWHSTKHKCRAAVYNPTHKQNARHAVGLNTSCVEQLWTRTNVVFPIARQMVRSKFRLFLRYYFAWRNAFTRGNYISDVSKMTSRKRALRVEAGISLRKRRDPTPLNAIERKPSAACTLRTWQPTESIQRKPSKRTRTE